MNDSGATTLDELLGGRVRLLQPTNGLRAAVDAVLLAAAVAAKAGEHVLDVGCGSGAAALCLAARVGGARMTGLDLQADLIALANRSAALNGMAERASFLAGDILSPPPEIADALFDHVMANPPYHPAGSGRVSPDRAKALASVEGAADLAAWVGFCARHVRAGGSVSFIHRADRAAEVAARLAAAGADTVIFPLGPKRAIVQGIAGTGGRVRRAPGLVLHRSDGAFTTEAEAILRHGQELRISVPPE